MIVCRGNCYPNPNTRGSPCYELGDLFCKKCDRAWINLDKTNCPCCGQKLRRKPANIKPKTGANARKLSGKTHEGRECGVCHTTVSTKYNFRGNRKYAQWYNIGGKWLCGTCAHWYLEIRRENRDDVRGAIIKLRDKLRRTLERCDKLLELI